MNGPRALRPVDLADTPTGSPRPRATTWQVGDTVQVGAVRWVVQVVSGDRVELEASSVSPGIWWRTTLANLPAKTVTS